MKKFFGRDRQYEEDLELEDLELEDLDDAFEEAEEYYEEGVYGEEGPFEEDAYYEGRDEQEFFEAEAEYAGEEPYEEAEAVYEGEEPYEEAEAVYEGEEPYEEAEAVYEGEEFYEEAEDLPQDGEVYLEEEEVPCEKEEGEEILAWSDMPDKNIFQKIWYSMLHMSTMNRVITTTGVLILILALAVGVAYAGTRTGSKEAASFDTVGAQLDGITLIGERGLTAVADAELSKKQTADAIEMEENGEYEENEYTREVEVVLNMTSIEKDLKLKFVNKNTNKLIANVPFSVTVTTPDGKTETWTDDDMDGIIYKSGITPGDYSVAMNALTDSKYAGYTISTKAVKVNVVKEIQYKKVDVSDEIKNESELTQKEDAEVELEVESELVDTVAWVESTVTPGKVTWTEVPKSKVDLGFTLTASAGSAAAKIATEVPIRLLMVNTSAADTPVTVMPYTNVVSPNPEENTTPPPEGSATPSPEGSETPIPEESPNPTPEATPGTTVTGVTLDKTTLSLAVGGTETLKATVEPADAVDKTVTWTSSNSEVAAVDKDGLVTAKKAGTAIITAEAGGKKADCTVTVAELGITLTPTALNIVAGGSGTATAVISAEKGTVTAAPGDPNVAAVSVSAPAVANGKITATVTVTAKAAGTTTITVTYKDGDLEKSEKLTVTVLDKDKKLVDKSGNQLWKKVGEDKYEEATYEDYNNYNSFYLRVESEPRYTGWQSIGGKMYYFDANGNKVTGEQVIQGAKYNFASDGSLVVGNGSFGIDVSKWNGKIDWNAVKNSGVSYVIIRCGYRGYGSGALVVDPYFEQNIKGATAAGIKVGVYFFTQAVNKAEAVEEASMVLQLVKGYTISYPIFLDVEYSGAAGNTGRADSLSVAARTDIIVAFCETIRNSGYTAGVYANKSWLTGMIDTGRLSKYKIWLAQYAATPTYTGRYDMWQYKSTGRVTGINGDVDLNLSYLGY